MTHEQMQRLHEAILSAFNEAELRELVRFDLEQDLDGIVASGAFHKVVFDLLTWAERQGRTPALVAAIRKARPANAQVQAIAKELLVEQTAEPVPPAPTTLPAPAAKGSAPSRQTQEDNVEVFFSYSHKDERYRKQLESHLSLLKRQGVITDWHDRRIQAGTEWAGQIDEHLESAGIILLLVSSDFLASKYCYDVELTRALERHEAREARVIPIILRPVDWHSAPFAKLQALPRDGKPVTKWSNRDEAFLDIAQGIRKAVEDLRSPS
jgi:hypothetical protein